MIPGHERFFNYHVDPHVDLARRLPHIERHRRGVVTVSTPSLRDALALLVLPAHDDREMYVEFLHYEGLAAISVSNARQAMMAAPAADIIITGLRLPGEIDGYELIGWLRRDTRTAHIPIVVLTACVWRADRERAQAAGCDVFLPKPCLPSDLMRELRRLLACAKPRH